MANENARRDANRVTTALGVTNDVAQEIRNLLIDPATGALLVTLGGGGGGPITGAENGLYISGSNVRLGTNPLIESTTIDGDGQSHSFTFTGIDTMEFTDITDFVVSSTQNTDLVGQSQLTLTTSAGGNMAFKTANVFNAVASIGDVPVLTNAATGEWDWAATSSLVHSEICDTDGDTCVETERTADDDTIRFKAATVDVLTATSTAFDVFGGVDINLERDAFSGTYTVFNDATSPVAAAADSAGVAWTDADETLASFVARGTAEATNSYTNTTAGITSKISANPSDARISYDNTISFEQMLLKVGPDKIALSALQTTNSTLVELSPFEILIDAKSKLFKLNEGTTATGTGTATNGMVLTLQDNSNGEAKWAAAPTAPITAAASGLYLNGSTVQMGTNPLLENVAIDGDSNTYSYDFTDLTTFTATGDGTLKLENNGTVGTTYSVEAQAARAQMRATDGTNDNGVLVTMSQTSLQATDGIDTSQLRVIKTLIDIDPKSGELYVNEGTTGTGAGTATNGMVLTLQDDANGLAEWAAAATPNLAAVLAVGNSTGSNGISVVEGQEVLFNHDGPGTQMLASFDQWAMVWDSGTKDGSLTFNDTKSSWVYNASTSLVLDDNFIDFTTNSIKRLNIESDGTLNVGATPNYEALVTSDDDIPNKKYVDDAVSGSTGLATKSGFETAGSFTGTPKIKAVTFATAFADANYSVSIIGADARSWTVDSQTAAGFTINSNSGSAPTANVSWTAIKHGETS